MKRKDIQELKQKPAAELQALAKEYREKIRTAMVDLASQKMQNVKAMGDLKKTLARILTFLHSK